MSLVSLLCINGYPVNSEEVQLYSVVFFFLRQGFFVALEPVYQAGLELTEIHLPLPPQSWN